MATYVELPHVKTWYDERGDGEPLVLLHGGVVDARFFEPNIEALRRWTCAHRRSQRRRRRRPPCRPPPT